MVNKKDSSKDGKTIEHRINSILTFAGLAIGVAIALYIMMAYQMILEHGVKQAIFLAAC
jgi:hypothetical protein